jgi:hypothetical protein
MKSVGQMIKQIGGLADTKDVTDWENRFVKDMVSLTEDGARTTILRKSRSSASSASRKHFA